MNKQKKWATIKTNSIINNLKKIIKTNDIDHLTKSSYNFFYLLSGFIAHYDLQGFKGYYNNVTNFLNDLKNSSDIKNPNYYIDDKFFQKDDYSKDYYTSKSETLQAIKNLIN
jgi:hypothetical protein